MGSIEACIVNVLELELNISRWQAVITLYNASTVASKIPRHDLCVQTVRNVATKVEQHVSLEIRATGSLTSFVPCSQQASRSANTFSVD